ncbi:MAG TPA: NUDIX domain-containing protein, partial [Cytophagaceae bacterium]
MKLFINDKTLKITKFVTPVISGSFDSKLNGKDPITSKTLVGSVLIEGATEYQIERLFKLLEIKKLRKLTSITLSVQDEEHIVQFIKDQFKIIRASGGVVIKDDKVLMIYRLSKWDLPKGKLERGEDPMLGAHREVEEECNIKVEVKEKLCSTWHTYIRKGRRILKKTTWYIMDCLDDSKMGPQIEENI